MLAAWSLVGVDCFVCLWLVLTTVYVLIDSVVRVSEMYIYMQHVVVWAVGGPVVTLCSPSQLN